MSALDCGTDGEENGILDKECSCIMTFPSVYHAFRAQKLLRAQGVEAELISIPRFLSGSCEGLALRFPAAAEALAAAALGAGGVEVVRTVSDTGD